MAFIYVYERSIVTQMTLIWGWGCFIHLMLYLIPNDSYLVLGCFIYLILFLIFFWSSLNEVDNGKSNKIDI